MSKKLKKKIKTDDPLDDLVGIGKIKTSSGDFKKSKTAKTKLKPKIRIKQVTFDKKGRDDDSVVNLKKSSTNQGPKDFFDEEDVTPEELKKSDSDFNWDELLDTKDDDKKKQAKKDKKKGFSFFGLFKKKDKPLGSAQGKPIEGKSAKTKIKSVDSEPVLIKKDKPFDSASPFASSSAKASEDKKATGDKQAGKKEKEIELPSADHPHGLPMGIYRKLAVGFVLLAIILIAVIFYFSFVKVNISVTLKDQVKEKKLTVSVYERSDDYVIPEQAIRGLVEKIEMEQSKVYEVAGTEVTGEEVSGKVKIINNYVKNQPLVATTRLLSPDGKLFRLKKSVNVPAGGSLVVDVKADQTTEDMVVGVAHFTIPGLWEGLQDKIYAESQVGDITYKQTTKKVISQSGIDQAVADLKQALLDKAKTDIDQTYSQYNQKIYQIDDSQLSYKVDGEVGDEVEQMSVTMKAFILVVAFNDTDIVSLVQAGLSSQLTADKEIAPWTTEELSYQLTNIDLERDIADMEVSLQIKEIFKPGAEIIDKKALINLSQTQLEDYLGGLPDIASHEVKISPSFIHKTPSLVDRIKIEVK